MKLFQATVLISASLFLFAFGMASRHYENAIYQFIHDIYRTAKANDPAVLAEFSIDTADISRSFSEVSSNVHETRNRLKSRVILPENLVNLEEKEISENKYELSAVLYGIRVNAELNKVPGENATCLRMYVQGHNGDPFAHDYHNEILKSSIEDGCDFLTMSMLGLGQNYGRARVRTH